MQRPGQRLRYWSTVIGGALAFPLVWLVYLLTQPMCGPLTGTTAGRIFEIAPWVLLALEAWVLGCVWDRLGRGVARPMSIVWFVGFSAAIGFVILVYWFGDAGCTQ